MTFSYTEFVDPRTNIPGGTNDTAPVIMKYNIDELETISSNSRNQLPDSSEEETYDSDENYVSSHKELLKLDNKPLPIECKYGTPENPYPLFKIDVSGRRVSDLKCQEYMWDLKYKIIDAEHYRSICRLKMKVSGVVGGHETSQGQFPHMGALGWLRNDKPKPISFCGSSLISLRFAISAAHCRSLRSQSHLVVKYKLKYLDPKVMIIGTLNLDSGVGRRMEINIDRLIVLPEYQAESQKMYNDIALVRLAQEVPISYHVRPACLWFGALGQQTVGNITGWGQTDPDDINSKETQLQYAQIDFISKEQCVNLTQNYENRNWKRGVIDSQFCAGVLSGGVDSCQGDSGGPIQVQKPAHQSSVMYYVVGITSLSLNKCAVPNEPGIYTNVSSFMCWVERTVWPEEPNSVCDNDIL